MIERVTVVGTGNLGLHLTRWLTERGMPIAQVYGRRMDQAEEIAALGNSQAIDQLNELDPNVDVFILAVSDRAIGEVAEQLSRHLPKTAIIAHTSGATPLDPLLAYFPRAGVFYPLQTFSRQRAISYQNIPLCIHAADDHVREKLTQLAHRLSTTVALVDDRQRALLHLAAVFVNNYTNFLYGIGQSITERADLPFSLLWPLMEETYHKAVALGPAAAQTGPARRGDEGTMALHHRLLAEFSDWEGLYGVLARAVEERYKND